MLKCTKIYVWVTFSFSILFFYCSSANSYENFKVAVYCRAYETRQMSDPNRLQPRWDELVRQVHVDKVYLETHRDMILVDEETMRKAKKFFVDKGIRTAGGITLTVNERNRFQTFCYTKPESRQRVKEIVEYTAKLFDEVILDDFFFTNCKCESCIKAKGDKSWTQFRLELFEEASQELIIKPAKAVNPKVTMVIKYPNWYEHFQGLGYNLEAEPKLFDKLYTGTETRDPVRSQQHLQQYQGYLIFRYLENIKPGGNAGGWVDTGGMPYIDRYAEQLWLTLFAKAPEIALFDFRQMQRTIRDSDRSPWHGQQTSLDFDEMIKPIQLNDGTTVKPSTIARTAGYTFEQVDRFLGKLSKPIGVKSYKPYHSMGEDFLHNFLGMCGIPMDLVPEFPTDANTIFLAESAKFDDTIIEKIKGQLFAGKTIVITSGLLRALQGKGIEDIVELEYTDKKAVIRDFVLGFRGTYQAKSDILIPQIKYLTNDSWEEITCSVSGIGYPILHSAEYANGILYVLTIPENFGDLYNFPAEVLTRIKETLIKDLYVRVDAPSQVALFVYDNETFIVESFLPEPVDVSIVVTKKTSGLRDILTGEILSASAAPSGQPMFGRRGRGGDGNRIVFNAQIKPHSYRVFQCE
ncbi:MAG: hypothetical protein A2173_01140 [Planctomycetes bacterium RBG_13_44_8b]|nr:MAG: hypothetical protein A2173_01140 [Planctomycetes bacterium RBG_13_44_8b]